MLLPCLPTFIFASTGLMPKTSWIMPKREAEPKADILLAFVRIISPVLELSTPCLAELMSAFIASILALASSSLS